MNPEQPAAASANREYLKILGIFYFISAGLHFCGVCLLALYLLAFSAIFAAALADPEFGAEREPVPPVQGIHEAREDATYKSPEQRQSEKRESAQWMLGALCAFAALMILALLALGVAEIVAGMGLLKLTRPTFTLVVGCINLLLFPLGTVLGVFTLILLLRPDVKQLYLDRAAAPAKTLP